MKEKLCKFQHVFFETTHQVYTSTCINPACKHQCTPVSNLVCDECPNKLAPDIVDDGFMEAVSREEEVIELPQRPPERQAEILETYCLRCKKFDRFSKICDSCICNVHIPIDEFVKYEHLHCPLELW